MSNPHGTASNCPFIHRKLDHVVLRCKSVKTMVNWYIDVLGAAPEWLDRFDGTFSHIRVGDSLIDLISYDCAVAFAKGTPATDTSALDHIALWCDDFELDDAKAWLAKHDVPILNSGTRYGADGNGFSIYVNDPEGNVVELKCG